MTKKATKQGISPITGTAPPKERQFGQPNGNPRHNGAWKKEDTPRFKLEKMMKLSDADLLSVENDELAPLFERKIAKCLRLGEWREIKEMIEQVYGKPQESVQVTNPDGSLGYKQLDVTELRKLANGKG